MKRILIMIALSIIGLSLFAQQYTGMSGLIHVPSAEMDKEGDARVGVHFLNREFSPNNFSYHTTTHYLSITPFSWVEIGYTCTLMKGIKVIDGNATDGGYSHKDRYFSVKIQPIKEGRWWPSVAVGTNDPYGTGNKDKLTDEQIARGDDGNSQYFCNYYVAATKHLYIKQHELGVHLAYRHFKRDYNSKWNGIVGGITCRPSFARNLRAIAEYTGNDLNIGIDCLLWKYFLLQASLQDGRYFSGGVCFRTNLF
ncbi:MAG: YjbH domain-containing protein [Bacteroidales bacterium]|nr:YjbH domain-containing protein [Bacteroidales bacterium]